LDRLTVPESQLAACETNANTVNPALTHQGYVPLPGNVNVGNPYWEDFNKQMLCGSASNTDTCPASQATGIGAGLETTCGNGVLEPFEDCDLGAALNSRPGASCSNTCRNN
jgi:cysteine-rich repeat protein